MTTRAATAAEAGPATPRRIATSAGELVLRAETPADDPFLMALFRAVNMGILIQAGLPDEMREQLIVFQHRSQTATYRGLFPDAIFSIVELDGEAIGRFIEHDEGEVVYFVDIAILPQAQRRGVGMALTHALMRQWADLGRATRVKILAYNEPSLAMCRKLGFVVTSASPQDAYVEMRWTPPAS